MQCLDCKKNLGNYWNLKCYYCHNILCKNCSITTQWNELVCSSCNHFIPTKQPFDDLYVDLSEMQILIEKHRYINHSNERLLKHFDHDYNDVLKPILTMLCACGVYEDFVFKLTATKFILNPIGFSVDSFNNLVYIDEFNYDIFKKNDNFSKNVFFLHFTLCDNKLEFKNSFKWIKEKAKFKSNLELLQFWNCEKCNTKFVNKFIKSNSSRVYIK